MSQRRPPEPPVYVPPFLPLTPDSVAGLEKLHAVTNKLPDRLTSVFRALTSAAADLGDALAEHPQYAKDFSSPHDRVLSELEDTVKATCDEAAFVDDMLRVLKELYEKERTDSNEFHRMVRAHEGGRGRRGGNARAGGGAQEGSDESDDDEAPKEMQTDVAGGLWHRHKTSLAARKSNHEKLSEKEKLEQINEFLDFKRTAWESRRPDIPVPRTWFSGATNSGDGNGSDDSDDGLEVAQETRSWKCPLTLVDFVDPVTNTECGHSFEKDAVLQMLGRKQWIQCPVPGCGKSIARRSLRNDPGLLRRMKKAKERERREEEERRLRDDESEDEDEDEDDDRVGVKKEKIRRRRATRRVMELDEEEEEEEEEEEDDD